MNQQVLPDLRLSGVNGAAGGVYGNVVLEGVSKIHGDVKTNTFRVDGLLTLEGGLIAETVDGNGKLKVNGALQSFSLSLDGMLTIGGKLECENCTVNGGLTVKKDGEVERFTGEGFFKVEGLLSAGTLDFNMQGQCKAQEIGVENLKVRQSGSKVWGKLFGGVIPMFKAELVTDSIEGNQLDLEYTQANVVRGDVVILGPGCHIGLVEYGTRLSVHPDAVVGREMKRGE